MQRGPLKGYDASTALAAAEEKAAAVARRGGTPLPAAALDAAASATAALVSAAATGHRLDASQREGGGCCSRPAGTYSPTARRECPSSRWTSWIHSLWPPPLSLLPELAAA